MIVMKFGGSSVKDATRINRVIELVQAARVSGNVRAVVFSALGGATDLLLETSRKASEGDASFRESLEALGRRHHEVVYDLIDPVNQTAVLEEVDALLTELRRVLQGVSLVKEATKRTLDFVMSFGERLSCTIITAALSERMDDVTLLDARTVMRTDEGFGAANVLREESYRRIRERFEESNKLQVVTGFIASAASGVTTTLGRGGSDLTASLLGAALAVDEIQIWTDVDGVLTADPRKVRDAFSIPALTFEEAMEMSHFGAKVIYSPTMAPAMEAGIPLLIKNTLNPEHPGTRVGISSEEREHPVSGISSIDNATLLQLKGSGMVGVAGISQRLFGALADNGISVILISQGSSEQSICFAVAPQHTDRAHEVVSKEFDSEMRLGLVNKVVVERDVAILAAVGESMRHEPGVAARLFQALGRRKINVMAIAQGSSELNISLVVRKAEETTALNAIHGAFFDDGYNPRVHVYLMGAGLIGGELMRQIQINLPRFSKKYRFKVAGIANSRNMAFDRAGVPLDRWREVLEAGEPLDREEWVRRVLNDAPMRSVVVDCTAHEQPINCYAPLLDRGIAVVTANKRAKSGSLQRLREIETAADRSGAPFLFETNVGAGLPVIATLRNLHHGGDRVHRIDAVLSGTLSYIFNNFDGSVPFSQVVSEARAKGFTEPDPREDLNGLDVARKLLILMREIGREVELEDLEVENLVPEPCRGTPDIGDFLREMADYDDQFAAKARTAAKKGLRLRYVAEMEGDTGRVYLAEVGPDHPAYGLNGTDNIVSYTTDYYNHTPLVVRGPGAGPGVTAGGVLADILRAAGVLL